MSSPPEFLLAHMLFSVSIAFLEAKLAFWGAAAFLNLFVGPIQASSRSLMSKLAPFEIHAKL